MLNLFFRKSEDNMFEDFRLKVFMAVAETGSFTKAAKSIGISQPAVSQNINALEKEIGTPLILRAKGEASLTSAGAVFLEYASRILYWYNATSEMFGENGRMTGGKPVRIAADHVVASYLLPDALARIAGSHPEFSFEVRHIDPAITRSTTNSDVPGTHFGTPEDADVEISVAPSPETMDFEGERKLVGVMEAMVIASPVSNRFAVWSGYTRFFSPDLQARTAIVSDSAETIKSMVADSVALVGIVPAMSVRRELAAGTLLQMPVLLPDFAFDVHFNALPEFEGRTICQLLRNTMKDNL